jgi:hypothetical protein
VCNLYSITRSQDAMRRLFAIRRDLTGNLPLFPAIFPDTMAPVIRRAPDGGRELAKMRWGFPPPPGFGKVPVTNVRNVASPYWRGWLKAEWRCLVPATSFCEWTDSRPKVTHWFALDASRPLFAFAGIWRQWTGERKGEIGEHRLFILYDDRGERRGAANPRQGHARAAEADRGMGYLVEGAAGRSAEAATALAGPRAADCSEGGERGRGARQRLSSARGARDRLL